MPRSGGRRPLTPEFKHPKGGGMGLSADLAAYIWSGAEVRGSDTVHLEKSVTECMSHRVQIDESQSLLDGEVSHDQGWVGVGSMSPRWTREVLQDTFGDP